MHQYAHIGVEVELSEGQRARLNTFATRIADKFVHFASGDIDADSIHTEIVCAYQNPSLLTRFGSVRGQVRAIVEVTIADFENENDPEIGAYQVSFPIHVRDNIVLTRYGSRNQWKASDRAYSRIRNTLWEYMGWVI